MTIHCMLDLETLGTGPRAAIIQIGACAFELDGGFLKEITHGDIVTSGTFEVTVSAQSSLFAGLEIDSSTLHWWRYTAPAEARLAVVENVVSLPIALHALGIWWSAVEATTIWANGAAFDPPILESAYRAVNQVVPWSYRYVRDVRTILELATDLAGWERPHRSVAHTALADAIAQAEDVRSAWQALKADRDSIGIDAQQ
jgi:Mesyanzhinovviridae exonuclease